MIRKYNSDTLRYVVTTPKSQKLQDEASRYLPGGSSRGTSYFEPYPFFVDRAEGHYVYDVDHNRYLDFMLNATTYIAGHSHPEVIQAVKEQASKGLSYSGPTVAQVNLAKLLCERVPSLEKIRFTNSGTEGTMNAIRAARAFTNRHKIAKFEGAYHGNHEYVSVTVNTPLLNLSHDEPRPISEWPGQPTKVLEDVIVLPYNNFEATESTVRAHADDLACVIMEPVFSNIGYVPSRPEFLEGIRALTDELGIILIFDEVQSFRLAPGGAQEIYGVTPDITSFGKIIGGGMPVGAWGGRDEIMSLYDPSNGPVISHSGTFNANPMTMVAGEKTLQQLSPQVYNRMDSLGQMLRDRLGTIFAELEIPVQITGIGSFFGIHFGSKEISDYRSMLKCNQELKEKLFTELLNERVLVQTRAAGSISILTTESEIEELVSAVRRATLRVIEHTES